MSKGKNDILTKDELMKACGFKKSGGKYVCEEAEIIIEDGKIQIITYDYDNHEMEPVGLLTVPIPINHIQFKSKILQ